MWWAERARDPGSDNVGARLPSAMFRVVPYPDKGEHEDGDYVRENLCCCGFRDGGFLSLREAAPCALPASHDGSHSMQAVASGARASV
jgi:hypothetical protein